MKTQFLLLSLLFSGLVLKAQKQGNIWYFGDSAGISFASGAPVAITGGQIDLNPFHQHNEAAAALSDSAGNLLMYSNGEKIWNRLHQVMPNGDSLMGHFSSSQGAVIVPNPKSSDLFYVFTTDAFLHNLQNGIRYSVVNMCLDGGYGDVVAGQKNILLADSISEKLVLIKHANQRDYWVVTHEFNSADFIAFRVSDIGIQDSVVSTVGSVHKNYCPGTTGQGSAIGQMKASPDGTKLVLMNGQTCRSISELFDFDPSTGVVSNPVDLRTDSVAVVLYGASFSPDNSKLYITSLINNDRIYQYDLTAGTGSPADIRASKTVVASFGSAPSATSMQLGPDGKIYISRNGEGSLAVLQNPNLAGSACGFLDYAIWLGGAICSYDLPNFMDSFRYGNGLTSCTPVAIHPPQTTTTGIYPQPVGESATFTFENPGNTPLSFHLYDLSGKEVIRQEGIRGNEFPFERRNLPPGIYFYRLSSEGGFQQSGKLLLK